jgi:hypothetical protein
MKIESDLRLTRRDHNRFSPDPSRARFVDMKVKLFIVKSRLAFEG